MLAKTKKKKKHVRTGRHAPPIPSSHVSHLAFAWMWCFFDVVLAARRGNPPCDRHMDMASCDDGRSEERKQEEGWNASEALLPDSMGAETPPMTGKAITNASTLPPSFLEGGANGAPSH